MDDGDGATAETETAGRRELAWAGVVAALAVAAYLPVLRAGWFSDDWQWLARMNPTLERPGYLFSVFTRDFNPTLHASFLADWIAAPAAAWFGHLHSVLIHGLVAGLLFLLARTQGLPALPCGLAALTWAWNARLAETAAWSAARGHSLGLLLVLAALLLWSRRERWALPAGLALWVLALLTKETALVPVVLLPLLMPGRWKRRSLILGVGAVGALFVGASLLLKPPAYTEPQALSFLVLKFPFMLLRPLGLGDYYDFSWPMALLVYALFAGAVVLARRSVALPGLAWVLLCSLPFLPLAKLSSRYLYLPSAGWVLVLAAGLHALFTWKRLRNRLALGAALAVLLVAWGSNIWRLQLEIEDQVTISAPYQELAALARDPMASRQPGETLVVADLSARDAIAQLERTLKERDTMTKLLPIRPRGVGGLIELADLVNAALPREPGLLAYPVAAPGPEPRRVFAYDGERFVEVREELLERVPPERIFAVRWEEAAAFFEAAKTDPER